MKIEDIKNIEGRHYLRVWIKALRTFVGWPRGRTLKRAEKWVKRLNDSDSLFFHDPPVQYIADILIPESLKSCLSHRDLGVLRKGLIATIDKNDSLFDRRATFDWKSAKMRLNAFLSEAEHKVSRKEDFRVFLIRCQNDASSKKPSKLQKRLLVKTFI